MTTISYNHNTPIKSDILINLWQLGFKLVPLSKNHSPAIDEWTPIYENPNYWRIDDFNDPKIVLKFKNVATTLGKTHIKDSKGNDLYIQVLDIDSENAFTLINTSLSQLVESERLISRFYSIFKDSWNISEKEFSEYTILHILKMFTFVTKTRKKHGYHFWWLSHYQNMAIRNNDCKIESVFEILTDKQGLCTLPPSTHRDDKKFNYSAIGITDKILISDDLYPLFIELFKDCLRNDYDVNKNKKNVNGCACVQNHQHIKSKFYDLSHKTIHSSIDHLLPYYVEGNRHDFTLAFTGTASHFGIIRESTTAIMEGICDKSNDYKEKNGRILSLNATYKKGYEGSPITGGPTLVDLIVRLKGCDVAVANEIVNDLKKLWENDIHEKEKETRNDEKNNTYDNSNKKENIQSKSRNIQEILMEIANENIEILFKDQLNEGFASVFIHDHYEIIPLRCSRFKKFLSKIYYENTNKVANAESINNVISILQAKAEFGNLQYPLSLRVAEHDGNIYYDLTNEKHQIIEISKLGNWKLIDKSSIP